MQIARISCQIDGWPFSKEDFAIAAVLDILYVYISFWRDADVTISKLGSVDARLCAIGKCFCNRNIANQESVKFR